MNLHVSRGLESFVSGDYRDGELTDQTLSALRAAFAQYGHKPSEAMWVGIRGLVDALERMANGTLDRLPHLSPLDPGVGKTECVIHFVRSLIASPSHSHVGILICVSHLKEIGTLARRMRLNEKDVAVYTTDEETNAFGCKDIDNARVLFVTQQMVHSRLADGKQFSDLELFHFKGQPRQVKIWDEALLPAEEQTLTIDAMARLPSLLRKLSSPLADQLHEVCQHVRGLANGATYHFADFVSSYGPRYEDVKSLFSKHPTRDREAARTLWNLSGKEVRVRQDMTGNTLLDYRNHLPEDFYPVVILDASGRVRTTYENWQKDRRNLVTLPTAQKSYDNLTVHVWNRGGGKSAFRTQASELIEGIAATINGKPDEQWLVILHKEDEWHIPGQKRIPDLMKLISDLVHRPDNVASLTWGNEKATNEFSAIKNVILAGTLFYPESVYEVRARASKGLGAAEELDLDSFKALELGEHKNLILQAACRGSVRKCVDDQGEGMDLYLIASNKTGIPYVLTEIFPGARLKQWRPTDKPLSGKVGEAVEYIDKHFKDWWAKPLPFSEVQHAIGMKYRQNFNQDIRQHPDFREALIKMQVRECSFNDSKRLTHFCRFVSDQ